MFEAVTYQEESFNEVIDEIKPLLELHYKEIAIMQDKIKLNPDYESYEAAYDAGTLRIFTAREGQDLVGYFIVVTVNHLHYKDHIFAMNDVIYLKKNLRALGIGKEMIQYAEDALIDSGVSVIMINTKVHQPFDLLMEALDYNCTDRLYGKYIGEE